MIRQEWKCKRHEASDYAYPVPIITLNLAQSYYTGRCAVFVQWTNGLQKEKQKAKCI